MVAATTQGTFEGETPIEVQTFAGPMFRSALAETCGRRPSYEDAYAISSQEDRASLWVFDGHRGDSAARYAADVFSNEEFGRNKGNPSLPCNKKILGAFQSIDRNLREHFCSKKIKAAGTTAVGAMVIRQNDGTYSTKLVNCGDSRAVVIRSPNETKQSAANVKVKLPECLDRIRLMVNANWSEEASWLPDWPAVVETIDHKPNFWLERARIEAAGGKVLGGRCSRVDGNLAVSRTIGDFDFKGDERRTVAEQKVSCLPDIYEVTGMPEGSVVLLACDGLWDVMSSEDAAVFVRERLQREPPMELDEIAEELISFSLNAQTGDNVTVLLTQLGRH
mmetsp:Transcript_36544/g.66264  ORF Transcript_36544/g.66264 Transcript_36544/m.66264 type:complete len:335 (+) Transcript_36544:91-1095(+)